MYLERWRWWTSSASRTVGLAVLLSSCSGKSGVAPDPDNEQAGRIPLNDLGSRTYLGFQGGLYPGGTNVPPAEHVNAGLLAAKRIHPLDVNGVPSATGKIVLLSIGMSNTTQEFCTASSQLVACDSWSFTGQASTDGAVNHSTLLLVNGAMGGQTADKWDAPSDSDYDIVRDHKLMPQGLSEKQVQIAWVKEAQAHPTDSLPSASSDAFQLVREQGAVLRALRARYPNLQQVFMSSRIYGGYATSSLNPEPFAYQGGFAVKWTIEAQIREMASGTVDERAGSLNYNTLAPWVAWGPYLWANGNQPRSDGLVWVLDDFVTSDRTHPAQSGRTKVADMLLQFFKTSQFTRCWFLAGQSC
jgi:hypothetical protein